MKPHLLILHVEPSLLELMRLILEQEGMYQVTTRGILFEDISEIERLQPHLILLGAQIYGPQTWWTVLQKLKLHRPTKDIPIILATTAPPGMIEQEDLFRQKGIPLLYMPCEIENFFQLIQQTLATSAPDSFDL